MELIFLHLVNTRIVLGLSIWILGFAFMTAGWLIGELSERWGRLPGKIVYRIGAIIVAVPVIVLLWKASYALYVNRFFIANYINSTIDFIQDALKVL